MYINYVHYLYGHLIHVYVKLYAVFHEYDVSCCTVTPQFFIDYGIICNYFHSYMP